jgi:hypothetical protein
MDETAKDALRIQGLEDRLKHERALQRVLAAGVAFYTRRSIEEVLKAAEDAVSAGEHLRG